MDKGSHAIVDTALLIIDVQNDMAHPDGVSGKLGSPIPARFEKLGIAARINALSFRARARGVPVFFVKHAYRPDYNDAPKNSFGEFVRQYRFCHDGKWGAELLGALQVLEGDVILQKNRESAFFKTPLDSILKRKSISHLVIVGIATDGAIEGTARDAQDRDYATTIVADCCIGSTEAAHAATLSGLMATLGSIAREKDLFS